MNILWDDATACWRGSFIAMGGPCEILCNGDDGEAAERVFQAVREEALRIEHKFSRYRDDSELTRINRSRASPITVDAETAGLLDYAGQCHRLSGGRFDSRSGVRREVWRFDGSNELPEPQAVAATLARVGWDKVQWRNPELVLPAGMELDLGGIGKEYAVDRSAQLVRREGDAGVLINFGGDIYITGPRQGNQPWTIGIDDPHVTGTPGASALQLHQGGVATSGDARRFMVKDGVRYSHILDPQTGWPVRDAPRSVTVVAHSCLEAGMTATFAMLHGLGAEAFLRDMGVPHRCIR